MYGLECKDEVGEEGGLALASVEAAVNRFAIEQQVVLQLDVLGQVEPELGFNAFCTRLFSSLSYA